MVEPFSTSILETSLNSAFRACGEHREHASLDADSRTTGLTTVVAVHSLVLLCRQTSGGDALTDVAALAMLPGSRFTHRRHCGAAEPDTRGCGRCESIGRIRIDVFRV
jgi:hypothetical protein